MNYFRDDNTPENNDPSPAENTDRVNGEYHYKNGYTQRIYSDAHYVRENETTAPPKYYTPPAEKPVKEPKPPKKKGGFIKNEVAGRKPCKKSFSFVHFTASLPI